MIKYLIILSLFISSIGFGQVGQWDSTQAIIYPTDTTAKIPLSATDTIYLINVYQSDSGLTYINRQSNVKMIYDFNGDATDDTIPATCLFQNYEFDSLVYARINEMTINLDGTQNLPQRITEIEVYSTATDRNSYFNTPFVLTPTMIIVKPSGGDYTTVQAANNASTNGDTVLVSGEINEGNFLTINKQLFIQGIGGWRLTNNAAQTQSIFVDADNVNIQGCDLRSNASTYGIYNTNQTNNKFKNCLFSGMSTNAIFLRGVDETSWNYVYNCVFDADIITSSDIIRTQTSNYIISECFFSGGALTGIKDFTTTTDGYNAYVLYNKSISEYTGLTFYAFACKNTLIKGNHIEANLLNYIASQNTSRTNFMDIEISDNYYSLDSTTNNNGFIKHVDTLKLRRFNVDNNTIRINSYGNSIPIYLVGSTWDLNITNNDIELQQGTSIYANGVNQDSLTINISNNKSYIFYSPNNTIGYNIFINNAEGTLPDYNVEIIGNDFRNPFVYGSPFGGHAVVYLFNVKKAKVWYNNIEGGEITGMHFKGANGTTAGIECVNTSFRYNTVDSTNILLKGVRNVEITNNTVTNSIYDDAIRVFKNEDAAPDEDCAYNTVQNNILISSDNEGQYPLFVGTASDTAGMVISNNIYWGNDSVYFIGAKTYTQYNSLGFDANSFNTDPLLNVNGVPNTGSVAIGNGLNLGSPYNFGLIPNATFPNPSLLPQKAKWTIGAYVVPLGVIAVSNIKIVIGNGGKIIYY